MCLMHFFLDTLILLLCINNFYAQGVSLHYVKAWPTEESSSLNLPHKKWSHWLCFKEIVKNQGYQYNRSADVDGIA